MNFGFLIFPGLEELDLVGPWEMIGLWSRFAKGPENCLMVAERPGPVTCSKGMSLNPHFDFSSCPKLDYLLVPGGEGTGKEMDNSILIKFVAEQAEHCRRCSVSALEPSSSTGRAFSLAKGPPPTGRRFRGFGIWEMWM
jgi:transcriptional regulator GlxA family with amidase domain